MGGRRQSAEERALPRKAGFVVVQDLFLTETAKQADIVLPAASAYEKNGTVTNVTRRSAAAEARHQGHGHQAGPRDHGLHRRGNGRLRRSGPGSPDTVFDEIRKTVHGYDVPLPVLATGGAAQTMPVNGRVPVRLPARSGAIRTTTACSRPARSGAILRF